jgi:hypothetical protein
MKEQNIVEPFQHENITTVDDNYIYLVKLCKYILNFLAVYLVSVAIIYNFPSVNINQFVLIICAISSVCFYILDLNFPICNV